MRIQQFLLIGALMAGNLLAQTGNSYFIAVNGSSSGNGSQSSPWNIATALAQPSVVKPGDTLWLRGGTYGTGGTTVFTSNLNGTAFAPIIVRQYPGERAVIDGGIQVNGSYTWFWGFEITNSSTVRIGTSTAIRSPGLFLVGQGGGNKAINMVIHDTGHPGIQFNDQSDQGEVYGSLLWGNGVYDTVMLGGTTANPVTRGDGIYAQNDVGKTYITDSIFLWNFTYGIKAYAEGGSVNGFRIKGNISIENGQRGIFAATHTSGSTPVTDLQITDNMVYQTQYGNSTLHAGYRNPNNDAIITNNYLVGANSGTTAAFNVVQFPVLTVNNNTSVSVDPSQGNVAGVWTSNSPANWDRNSYFGGQVRPFNSILTNAYMDFNTWRSTMSVDANSTYSSQLPTGLRVFVRPNQYEPNRGHVAVYNWGNLQAVSVDVSSFLNPGTPYEVRDAQNFFGPAVSRGTYSGGPISIPMNLTAITPLVGAVSHMPNLVHTAPRFAAFVILPATAPGQAAAPVVMPNAGTFNGAATITMMTPVSGASIFYTLDGSTPTAASARYSGPFTIYRSANVRAITVQTGMSNSIVTPASITVIPDTVAPVISSPVISQVGVTSATITWTTNEPSDTQVEYGVTTAYGTFSPLNTVLSTAKSVTITGLTGDTAYNLRIRSRDAAGNLGLSQNLTFRTNPVPDTTAPVISGWTVVPTQTGATITYITNEASTTEVTFGTTTALGSTSGRDNTMVTRHVATISGLPRGTRIYYRMWSYDAAGNMGKTAHVSFNTLP